MPPDTETEHKRRFQAAATPTSHDQARFAEVSSGGSREAGSRIGSKAIQKS
jgi:hypothetical protein